MGNRKNRIPLLVSDGEVNAIDDYRWRNRVPSFAEAVRQLIAKGIEADQQKAETVAAVSAP